jgi:hypothetical protein
MVWATGLVPAALAALRIQNTDVRKKVLGMLCTFLTHLSNRLHTAAVGELVNDKGVELVACVIAAGGMDVLSPGLAMLLLFVGESESRERMYTQGIASQLIHSIAKWLLKVCEVTATEGYGGSIPSWLLIFLVHGTWIPVVIPPRPPRVDCAREHSLSSSPRTTARVPIRSVVVLHVFSPETACLHRQCRQVRGGVHTSCFRGVQS